jgi:DNA-binding NtrC family response regulator
MTKKHILIVEDDSTQIKVFKKIIDNVNIKSHLLSNGTDAVKYLQENQNNVALVLLDLALPDISGIQVLEELKKMDNKVPVAILSSNEDSSIALKAGQLGAIDFFIKGKSDLMKIYKLIDDIMHLKNL